MTAPTTTNRIEALNDFVIKFANVNGSGSASANELFAKSFLRMGIPVSPRNIFPSNIQGLPTWYEVRINENGYRGRRGDYLRYFDRSGSWLGSKSAGTSASSVSRPKALPAAAAGFWAAAASCCARFAGLPD